MKKIIIFSIDVYNDLDNQKKIEFIKIINGLQKEGNIFVFTSKTESKLIDLEETLNNKDILFINRNNLKSVIKSKLDKANYFVVIGNREADLFMAASNKLFYIVPMWCNNYDDRVLRYGIRVNSLVKLFKLIKVLENQNSWFYRLDLDAKTTVLSLTNANTFGNHSVEELEMINGFRALLKNGDKQYYEVLLYHFLAAISNKAEFRGIKDWAIFPSSGIKLNEDMWIFKEKARELMNGKKKDPIFLRHTATWKSHNSKKLGKNRLPCDRHFDTIILNEKYKNKLKGRTVCIFDDYLDNGTSFESARNLLIRENISKIFFVSLGRFHKRGNQQYCRQDYNISGSIYKNAYKYSLAKREWYQGKFDYNAVAEIENLYDIMFK